MKTPVEDEKTPEPLNASESPDSAVPVDDTTPRELLAALLGNREERGYIFEQVETLFPKPSDQAFLWHVFRITGFPAPFAVPYVRTRQAAISLLFGLGFGAAREPVIGDVFVTPDRLGFVIGEGGVSRGYFLGVYYGVTPQKIPLRAVDLFLHV